ncbi:MAG: hypothetical protein PHH91_14780 [Desulfuromonadaceae bacterium]|nr:hypothetical protein [Desulfuromonadaceae bacterium]
MLIVKVALTFPAVIVTVVGTLTDDELSLNDTTTPPLGAGALNVTVPWDVEPPLTVVGFNERALNTVGDGFTVIAVVFVTPP